MRPAERASATTRSVWSPSSARSSFPRCSRSTSPATPRPRSSWTTFAISLLVAASAAIDGFFHFGSRWRHYRGTVERLKSEGWSFAELSGNYHRPNSTHRDVFPDFVSHVEQTLGQEVEDYVEGVAGEARPKPREG